MTSLLTKLTASKINEVLHAYFSSHEIVTTGKQGTYVFSVMRTDDQEEESLSEHCTVQVKVRQALENPAVRVLEFRRKSGSSLLFFDEFKEITSKLTK